MVSSLLFLEMAPLFLPHGLHTAPEGGAGLVDEGLSHGGLLLLDGGLQVIHMAVGSCAGLGLDVAPDAVVSQRAVRA